MQLTLYVCPEKGMLVPSIVTMREYILGQRNTGDLRVESVFSEEEPEE